MGRSADYVNVQVRAAIEASGKSRAQIARETGVSEATLSRLMSGERNIGTDSLMRLADAIDLEVIIRPKRRGKGR